MAGPFNRRSVGQVRPAEVFGMARGGILEVRQICKVNAQKYGRFHPVYSQRNRLVFVVCEHKTVTLYLTYNGTLNDDC